MRRRSGPGIGYDGGAMILLTKIQPKCGQRPDGAAVQVSRLMIRDLVQIVQMEQAVFLEPLRIWDLLARLGRRHTRYLVVREGGRLAAYFGFEVHGPYAHVISNVTAPTHRRQGLARLLLRAGEQWAKTMGARCFIGEVRRSNQAQLDVLKGIGWYPVEVIPHFFGNGEDAIIVWRNFDTPRDQSGD